MTGLPSTPLLVALMVMAGIGILAIALFSLIHGPRARLRRRIAQVMAQAATGGRGKNNPPQGAKNHRRQIQSKLKDIETVRERKGAWKLRERLSQSGLPLTPRHYILGSLAAGLLAALAALLFALPPAGLIALPVLFGVGLPHLGLNLLIRRRLAAFTGNFADALDVIVRGIRSGLPVGECFAMIAREFPDPVGGEFRQIVEAQRLGLPLEECLQKAQDRVPTPELRFFAIVLGIQQSTGGNLAETLSKLSDVLRGRKRMRDKIQAMSSEAKTSAAIIGSLPVVVALLLSLIAPQYISLLFTTGTGHLLLLIGVGIMSLGIFVMRQMINFDI